MTEINMVFELKDKKSINDVAQSLQDRISEMEMVEDVEAVVETPERMRAMTGLEIAAAVGVTVLVIRSGRELLAEVRKFVEEVKGLLTDIGDLKNVYLDIGKRRVRIDKLGPGDLEEVARKS